MNGPEKNSQHMFHYVVDLAIYADQKKTEIVLIKGMSKCK
jgi:hypothetical protein